MQDVSAVEQRTFPALVMSRKAHKYDTRSVIFPAIVFKESRILFETPENNNLCIPLLIKRNCWNVLQLCACEQNPFKIDNSSLSVNPAQKETRPRRDLTKNFGQDQDETESLGVFFYETETRTYF